MAHIIYTYKGRVINLTALSERLKTLNIPGSSLGNLSRVFSGRHRPRLDLAMAIARLGGIPVDEIDLMLAHCKKQREQWDYAPSWGQFRSARETQRKGMDKRDKGLSGLGILTHYEVTNEDEE